MTNATCSPIRLKSCHAIPWSHSSTRSLSFLSRYRMNLEKTSYAFKGTRAPIECSRSNDRNIGLRAINRTSSVARVRSSSPRRRGADEQRMRRRDKDRPDVLATFPTHKTLPDLVGWAFVETREAITPRQEFMPDRSPRSRWLFAMISSASVELETSGRFIKRSKRNTQRPSLILRQKSADRETHQQICH